MDFEILDETAFEVAADVGLICYDLSEVEVQSDAELVAELTRGYTDRSRKFMDHTVQFELDAQGVYERGGEWFALIYLRCR